MQNGVAPWNGYGSEVLESILESVPCSSLTITEEAPYRLITIATMALPNGML